MIRRPKQFCSFCLKSGSNTGVLLWVTVLFIALSLGWVNADELLEVSETWTVISSSNSGGQKVGNHVEIDPIIDTETSLLTHKSMIDEVSADWTITVLERQKLELNMAVESVSKPDEEQAETEIPFSIDTMSTESVDVIAVPDAGGFSIDDSVPAGFEALAGPQTHFVDLYFNERKAGETSITGTDETFVFDMPEDVLAMLEGVKKRHELVLHLAGTFDSNAHLICYRDNDSVGCGQVEANPIAALYNPSKLKVELFLSEDFQEVLSQDQILYLPAAERRNSAIASFNAVVSDLHGEQSSLDLSSRALLGYGNGHLAASFDYNTRTKNERLRELRLTHFSGKHEFDLGTYAYQAGGGLSDFSLFGASFSSTLKTRVDLEHAFSSELVVFLTRRSVVQLLVRDQIYSGESYAAGNQVLDTRALPEGSYEVEIRIIDPISGERTELRAFTKSTQIPPRGEWVYNATVGMPVLFDDERMYPELTDTAVIGASLARRISDSTAGKLGFLQLGERSFLQSEYLYLGQELSLHVAASVGEDRTLATSFLASYSKNSLNGGLSLETFQSNASVQDNSEFADVFQNDYKQLSLSLGRNFKSFYLGLRSSHREQMIDNTEVSLNQYSVNYRRSLFNKKSMRGFLDLSFQKDEIEEQLLLQLKVFFKRDQWQHALSGALFNSDIGGRDNRVSAETSWHSKDLHTFQIDAGAYASRASQSNTFGSNLDVQHSLFSLGLSSDWNEVDNGGFQPNNVASLSAYLGLDGRGFAIGGTDFAQAGVIISVKGEPHGEKFDIVVNGAKTSIGQIGTNQFIGLQPFETYRIKLVPKTLLSNGLGEDVYEFTLYPGNVQRIDLVTEQKILLIANLQDEFGQLLEAGVVETKPNPQLLSAGGFIQAEVPPGKVLRVRREDGGLCEFVVPDGGKDAVLVMDEPLLCRPVRIADQVE